jgi:hypothetical protein
MATLLFPLVFAIVGAFVYLASSNGKTSEMGRMTFFSGMVWLVYVLSRTALHF